MLKTNYRVRDFLKRPQGIITPPDYDSDPDSVRASLVRAASLMVFANEGHGCSGEQQSGRASAERSK